MANGERPVTRVLAGADFRQELSKKLQEEVDEFLVAQNIEELADIQEVVHGILQSMDKSFEELEAVRIAKKEKRGGFERRIFLETVETD
jgi:predicted house-cleaning noncanonical NTP pyrophosphatase (MazG superfamily)